MKKYLFYLLITPMMLLIFDKGMAQGPVTPITQPGLYKEVGKNMVSREVHISGLKRTLKKAKNYKEKTLAAWTTVEQVHHKIYDNLTNVSSGIRDGKTLATIMKKIPKITENVFKAGKEAAGKPYLIKIYSRTGMQLIDRVDRLKGDIKKVVESTNKDMLINQAKRSQILWNIYKQVKVIYNISQTMVYEFKWYNLQTAINEIFPYKYYIDLDKGMVDKTLNRFKF